MNVKDIVLYVESEPNSMRTVATNSKTKWLWRLTDGKRRKTFVRRATPEELNGKDI